MRRAPDRIRLKDARLSTRETAPRFWPAAILRHSLARLRRLRRQDDRRFSALGAPSARAVFGSSKIPSLLKTPLESGHPEIDRESPSSSPQARRSASYGPGRKIPDRAHLFLRTHRAAVLRQPDAAAGQARHDADEPI